MFSHFSTSTLHPNTADEGRENQNKVEWIPHADVQNELNFRKDKDKERWANVIIGN